MCVCKCARVAVFLLHNLTPASHGIIIVYVRTWPVGRSNVLLSRLTCKLQAVIVDPNDGFLYANCLYLCSVTLNIMHNHFADIRSLIFIARNLFSALAFLWMPFSLLSLSFLCGLFIMWTIQRDCVLRLFFFGPYFAIARASLICCFRLCFLRSDFSAAFCYWRKEERAKKNYHICNLR